MQWLSGPVAEVTALLSAQLFSQPIAGRQYAGRVTPWPPAQPVAPCAWLEVTSGTRGFDDALWLTLVEVVLCVDGEGDSAHELLYALGDRCIAIVTAPSAQRAHDMIVTGTRPVSLDVGGPSLRGLAVTIEVAMPAPTMCSPALLEGARHG